MINNMMQPQFDFYIVLYYKTKRVIKQETKDSIARSKDIPSSTLLPGNGARKELDVYYATLFL